MILGTLIHTYKYKNLENELVYFNSKKKKLGKNKSWKIIWLKK